MKIKTASVKPYQALEKIFVRRVCWWIIAIVGLLWGFQAVANNPGGWTPSVTTPVTTGTEVFGTRTDQYLDNGILHVLIAANGNVDSIKYLKPGLAGTPSVNGVEMVSQSGVNFGNHTAIYYYWYPDGNGSCVPNGSSVTSTNIDLAFLRTYNPAVHAVAANVELHYMLGQGNTALYAYLIVSHPSSFSTYNTNLNISFIQCLWPTAHDANNFLCENLYLDNNVKLGLFQGGVQSVRSGSPQPTFYDSWNTVAVPGMPVEISKYTTGLFNGSTNGKYSYTFDYPTYDTWGVASEVNQLGEWFIMGGHEYQNNGPTACEYSTGGLITFEPLIAHYGNTGLNVANAASFNKVYGPWLFYFNGQSTGPACWQDAKNQAVAEKSAWPYTWLTNSLYQSRNQRASVTGKLVINDPLRPQANAAGAWVGLAAPDSGLLNDPNNWQFQSDGYQFWTQCAADGTFTLPPVTTFTPYGGAATYQLYAYCSGTNGSVGEFRSGPYTFAPGTTTNLGTLTWTVPHQGLSIAWEIGLPNRTTTEFRHGNEYSRPGMWLGFHNEFPNPLTYTVGTSNWTNDWNFIQSGYYLADGVTVNNWTWQINFNLASVPTNGNLTLSTVWAGAAGAAIQVFVNDPTMVGPVFRDFYPNVPKGANSMIRQGAHDKYGIDYTSIPASKFVTGANSITLVQRRAITDTSSYVMYDYVNLELPVAGTVQIPAAPTGLTAAAGNAQVALSWTASSGATSYSVKRATVSGGPYTTLASATTTSYTDTTAVNGTTYYYVVSAVNTAGESVNSTQASATPCSIPAPPTGLSAVGGNAQVSVSWTASSGAASYNVSRATVSGGPYTQIATGVTTTSYTDTGLAAGMTYFYTVVAVNACGASGYSSYIGSTTIPPIPTGLTATAGNAQVALNWTASSGATSYNVKRATVNGGPYTTIASPTTTSYTDTTAVNGTTYYYVVSAVNASGESANSAQVSATPIAPPAAPTGLTATAVSANQINLSWTASSGATSYNVKRATVSGGPYTTVATGVTTTSYSNTGLTGGTTYYYVVSAVNTGGEGANSAQASATTLTPPAVPTTLTATTTSSSQINLAWTASTGATSYNVKRAPVSGGPYTTVTNITTTSFSNTGLSSGTTYYYVVSALNTAGESANSTQASAITISPAPTGLAATAGNAQAKLSWTATTGAASYNIKRATVSGGPYATVATGVTSLSYTNTALTNGTVYYYVISAVNAGGESANSAQVSVTPTAGSLPAAPTGLTATAAGNNSDVRLNWTAVTGATSYKVKRATVNGGPYTVLASPTTNTYTDTTPVQGTTYYYVVSAVNATGEGSNSAQVSIVGP